MKYGKVYGCVHLFCIPIRSTFAIKLQIILLSFFAEYLMADYQIWSLVNLTWLKRF